MRLRVSPGKRGRGQIVNGVRNVPRPPLRGFLVGNSLGLWWALNGLNWRAEAMAKVTFMSLAVGFFVVHPKRCRGSTNNEPNGAAGAMPGVEAMRVSEMWAHGKSMSEVREPAR